MREEQSASDKASVLLEALPYIRRFQGKVVVIKYGGSIMFDQQAKERFCKSISLLRFVGMQPIVVHGGGKEISKWLDKLDIESEFIDGLRVTDARTMELTEMVLSGKINKDLVHCINQSGGKAVGLSGKDANLFLANKRKIADKDLGQVGQIKQVDCTLLNTLSDSAYIPVVSSIAVSLEGETLNINADEAASAIAGAIKASKLIFLTDVDGVILDEKLQESLALKDAEDLVKEKVVTGGMLPKLQCAVDAIKSGVDRVHILNGSRMHAVLLEIFTDSGVGTMIQHKRKPN